MPTTKGDSIKIGPGCAVRRKRDRYYLRFYDPERRPKEKMIALVPVDDAGKKATTRAHTSERMR